MKKKFQIIINGKKIQAFEGQTVFQAAKKHGIEIPAFCYHSDLKIKANCRICVVEIKGIKDLQTSCSVEVKPGMEIMTDTPRIRKARRINLELIFAQHFEECNDCVWESHCQLLKLAKKQRLKTNRFIDRKKDFPVYQFGDALIFDSSKCIDCYNCVEMCEKQGVGFLKTKNRGVHLKIVPTKDKNKDCIYCGQCIVHCPAGAFEGVGEFEEIEKPFQQKGKLVVVQFAPSIRTSIGEEFNIPLGVPITEKLVAGIKKLGVEKVFDVSVGADFTTVEESKELIKKLEGKGKLPMFTSCCPAWVKFVEFYFPEFITNLTSVRSPHIILGGLIKTFWAKKQGIDPKKIIVVSIMPCVAKKHEITRKELKINGLFPVDYVLTTRELAALLKKKKIDLKKISPRKIDTPLGFPSGAGIIYGATGGVMESALRTASEEITNKPLKKLEFKQVRGMDGVKKAKIKIKNHLLKLVVINGTGQAKKILKELKINPLAYDYIEVMACPGGCVGGGGQPVPVNLEIREKRAKGLYKVDRRKNIRLAHQNPIVQKIYKEFLNKEEKIHTVCHTKYSQKKKQGFKILPPGQH